jgi:hypothetical protein
LEAFTDIVSASGPSRLACLARGIPCISCGFKFSFIEDAQRRGKSHFSSEAISLEFRPLSIFLSRLSNPLCLLSYDAFHPQRFILSGLARDAASALSGINRRPATQLRERLDFRIFRGGHAVLETRFFVTLH